MCARLTNIRIRSDHHDERVGRKAINNGPKVGVGDVQRVEGSVVLAEVKIRPALGQLQGRLT